MTSQARFYGDYHTAGAYYVKSFGQDWKSYTYHYYPVWIQPNGNVRVAHVTFNKPKAVVVPDVNSLDYLARVGTDRTTAREEIDVSRLTIQRTEEEDETRREVIRPEGERQ